MLPQPQKDGLIVGSWGAMRDVQQERMPTRLGGIGGAGAGGGNFICLYWGCCSSVCPWQH